MNLTQASFTKTLLSAIAILMASVSVSMPAQAAPLPVVVATFKSINTSMQFHTAPKASFKASNGVEIAIHMPRSSDDNRILIMDKDWSIVPNHYTTANHMGIIEAAYEYARSEGLNVELKKADQFYYDGSHGFAYEVEVKDESKS
ncbi:hypothetical protein L1D44_16950 [Shewanella sp. Isolate13]|uniref:hypothetical protein n=1 Tax=Shewanella sp. Isolate13 TaxID=2908531 RepID=UPI001EFC8BBD|nr:hypothetical protein [Shewanella sp. Isolate13]MCG9731483.1 hypothetical protein [Shewanella sp. Isolate13]